MFNTRRSLATRSDRVKLAGANEPVWKTALFHEGDTDSWRIVEVSSLDGRPFDIELGIGGRPKSGDGDERAKPGIDEPDE